MKGDYTRFTFKPEKHYSAVRRQQGRVDVDADWNEYVDILAHLNRTEVVDVIGHSGVPEDSDGFKVGVLDPDMSGTGVDLTLSPGRIYVEGILCEHEGDLLVTSLEGEGSETDAVLGDVSIWIITAGLVPRTRQWVRIEGGLDDGKYVQVQVTEDGPEADPRQRIKFLTSDVAAAPDSVMTVRPITTYGSQPYYPVDPDETLADGDYLAYLDVWERHITALDDPAIREVALGGPDTATRSQTIWQLKLQGDIGSDPVCADFEGWAPDGGATKIMLAARAQPGEADTDPCIVTAGAGYRRLENQLYRVEIHDDGVDSGTPTYKWSRENGSIVARLLSSSDGKLTVTHPRKDSINRFATNDWVEVLTEEMVLRGEPGPFVRLGEVNDNELNIAEIDGGPDLPETGFIRRWEGGRPVEVTTGDWLPLESGVEVRFASGLMHSGDYWTIPARTISHSVEWPVDESSAEPLDKIPEGIIHHYSPLALVNLSGGDWSVLHDCRDLFPPLTDLPLGGCCLRVDPDDDLQQAVDRLIAEGGGCICLGKGVHVIDGPLNIFNASNLHIHGESNATVLVLRGLNEMGMGGVSLVGSRNVSLQGMTIIGQDTQAVVWALYSPYLTIKNEGLMLKDLTVINLTQSPAEATTLINAAVRLSNVEHVVIEHSILLAEIGIVGQFSDWLPLPYKDMPGRDDYGEGVVSLNVRQTQIRYQQAGIWSLKNRDGLVQACHIAPLLETHMAAIIDLMDDLEAANFSPRLAARVAAALETTTESERGVAISAYNWSDSRIEDCHLAGAYGTAIWWWFRGEATGNTIKGKEIGLYAVWLHDATWQGNRIESSEGVGLAYVGCYRARISDNHVRAAAGLINIATAQMFVQLAEYIKEVAQIYSVYAGETGEEEEIPPEWLELLALYVLLREFFRYTRLYQTLDELRPLLGGMDPVFFISSLMYYYLLEPDNELDWSAPMIDLRFKENDVAGTAFAVSLDNMFMLGGANLVHNRLQSLAGQALALNASLLTAHPQFLVYGWRFLMQLLINSILPAIISGIADNPDMSDEEKAAWGGFFTGLLERFVEWSVASEAFLEADNRIESNNLRSYNTAIESNLWGISVQDNHITLQEHDTSNAESAAAAAELAATAEMAALAYAMRDASRHNIYRATRSLNSEHVLADRTARANAANAVFAVASGNRSQAVKEAGTALANALNSGSAADVAAAVEDFAYELARLVDSYGVWIKAPGCQVRHNHVLVPDDIAEDNRGRGGIRVSNDADEENSDALVFMAMLMSTMEIDPLLGISETLIEGNEVIGGMGHGVHIQAPIQLSEQFNLGYVNLKVQKNEIVGMAGAGINIDNENLAVGVDIDNNKIGWCSTQPELAGLTNEDGGIVVENAALCRITNNRIKHCGIGQQEFDVFGMSLEAIYGLTLHGNYLMANGGEQRDLNNGGISMTDIFGDIALTDNQILYANGIALIWNNSEDNANEPPLPFDLFMNLNLYVGGEDSLNNPVINEAEMRLSRAVFEGNQIKMRDENAVQAFSLFNLDQLIFTDNNCKGQSSQSIGSLTNIRKALVFNNNVFENAYASDSNSSVIICKAQGGTVMGNVSNRPISVYFSDNMTITNNVVLNY